MVINSIEIVLFFFCFQGEDWNCQAPLDWLNVYQKYTEYIICQSPYDDDNDDALFQH